jgi:peptidyl-prolyl cis-trans isomerase C
MHRSLFAIGFAASALVAAAQTAAPQTAASQDPSSKVVAVINGEQITAAKLDQMYSRSGAQMRAEYEKNGGKVAFLDNYIRKRLLVQEALKAGFDKKPDVQADMETAKESVLFDRYVRDVVAAQIINDSDVKKYYDEHPSEFQRSDSVKVRHIVITPNGAGPRPKTAGDAMDLIKSIAADLHTQMVTPTGTDPAAAARVRAKYFSAAARKYSEDGSAPSGGDLGWVSRGLLDPTFEDAAFNLPIGVMSGIIETRFGYHLIFVEARKPAGTAPFDEVKQDIRENLLAQRAADVMQTVSKLTNELETTSKVAIYPENVQ